ncbi:MAG: hypothetical protein ACFFFT_06505 [Candidatus Thorarchaeota archaeon]
MHLFNSHPSILAEDASQLGMDAVMIRDPNELDPYRIVEVDWKGPKIENFSEIMDLI